MNKPESHILFSENEILERVQNCLKSLNRLPTVAMVFGLLYDKNII